MNFLHIRDVIAEKKIVDYGDHPICYIRRVIPDLVFKKKEGVTPVCHRTRSITPRFLEYSIQ